MVKYRKKLKKVYLLNNYIKHFIIDSTNDYLLRNKKILCVEDDLNDLLFNAIDLEKEYVIELKKL